MTNNKQQTAVDSIIEFCQKQMENDSSIHKGVYLSIIKFCKEQAKAMEKEQITAFAKLWEEKLLDGRIDSVDDLYNETYGK